MFLFKTKDMTPTEIYNEFLRQRKEKNKLMLEYARHSRISQSPIVEYPNSNITTNSN